MMRPPSSHHLTHLLEKAGLLCSNGHGPVAVLGCAGRLHKEATCRCSSGLTIMAANGHMGSQRRTAEVLQWARTSG